MRDEVEALKRKLEDRSAAASLAAQVGPRFVSALETLVVRLLTTRVLKLVSLKRKQESCTPRLNITVLLPSRFVCATCCYLFVLKNLSAVVLAACRNALLCVSVEPPGPLDCHIKFLNSTF